MSNDPLGDEFDGIEIHEEDWDIYQPDPYDQEVERELIRQANERKSALTQLREALEQMRLAANRINKATWLWRNDGHN